MSDEQDVIYDIGANNGDDLPYYMKKAKKVVAVEANPVLAQHISSRFPEEIETGCLVVQAVAVTGNPTESSIRLYVHKVKDVMGTTTKPAQDSFAKYDVHDVPTTTLQNLITVHGDPLYVKLDIEGLDAEVLRSLLSFPGRPPYISAEGHDPRIFGLLAGMGGYTRFKIVEGSKVKKNFKDLLFQDREGKTVSYSFPWHSAGPFGEDIPGQWLNATDMFNLLRVRGLGWYDLHASMGEEPAPNPEKVPLGRLVEAVLECRHPRVLERYRALGKRLRKTIRFFKVFRKS